MIGGLLLLFLSHCGMAAELGWSTAFHDGHKFSSGASIPSGTRFQLGRFIEGFIPTAANVAEWREHWRGRGETSFVDLGGGLAGFSGSLTVEENTAPFTAGAQLYIWGFRQTSTLSSEWFLATSPSWTMPDADPAAFPVYIDVTDAANVVLGSVDQGTQSLSMASVPLTECPSFSYADWLIQEFFQVERANPLLISPEADPDGDGLMNILEYSLGTSPRFSSTDQQFLVIQPLGEGWQVQVPTNPSASKSWSLQESSDLVNWTPKDNDLVYDGPNQVWTLSVTSSSDRHFWRLIFPP